jgi:hypothetical protein
MAGFQKITMTMTVFKSRNLAMHQQILANRPPAPNSGGAGARWFFMFPQNWGLGGLIGRNHKLIWD